MELKKISSCDDQGTVYIGEDNVFRIVPTKHIDSVIKILNKLNNEIEGIVKTKICEDENINLKLKKNDELILQHQKISPISYPHEWCALMLKDAALFQLDLSINLYKEGLYLKDAHPWNILFEKGSPVFVDFTSVVNDQALLDEDFLDSNASMNISTNDQISRCIQEIYQRMFKPYFFNPLLSYVAKDSLNVRKDIENTTLNTSSHCMSLKNCFPKNIKLSKLPKLLKIVILYFRQFTFQKRLLSNKNVPDFLISIKNLIKNIALDAGSSDYSSYYSSKGEDQEWTYSDDWNLKQKSVHKALNKSNIKTILDVACNTGWFAIMAEKINKSVIAFDIDEGCIEELYKHVKENKSDVLPLVMNFTELTKDRFSIHDGNIVLFSAESRFKSDSVIALGIIHHLVLGLGLSLNEIVSSLNALSRKQLVIEFIDLNDSMIQGEPSFFPAFFKDSSISENYNLDELISILEANNYSITIESSFPDTRKILVCEKASL